MTATKVRADYEQLTEIARAFGQQAETAQRVLGALQKNVSTLQEGDWVGKGSEAFYAEMNSAVLPAMSRVVAAMNEAATTTQKISQVMKQAEDDSAALFRLARTPERGAGAGPASTGTVFKTTADKGEARNEQLLPAGTGGGQPAGVRDRRPGKVVRVERQRPPEPPGPGNFTPAKLKEWKDSHPNYTDSMKLAGPRDQDEKYTPRQLRRQGYTYGLNEVDEENKLQFETWVRDESDGELLIVVRPWPG